MTLLKQTVFNPPTCLWFVKVEHKPARDQDQYPGLLLGDNSEEYVRRPADDLLGFRCYEAVKVSLGQKVKVAGGQNLSVPGAQEKSADTSPGTSVPALILLTFRECRKLAIAQI